MPLYYLVLIMNVPAGASLEALPVSYADKAECTAAGAEAMREQILNFGSAGISGYTCASGPGQPVHIPLGEGDLP
jgi:hypothetical protein